MQISNHPISNITTDASSFERGAFLSWRNFSRLWDVGSSFFSTSLFFSNIAQVLYIIQRIRMKNCSLYWLWFLKYIASIGLIINGLATNNREEGCWIAFFSALLLSAAYQFFTRVETHHVSVSAMVQQAASPVILSKYEYLLSLDICSLIYC